MYNDRLHSCLWLATQSGIDFHSLVSPGIRNRARHVSGRDNAAKSITQSITPSMLIPVKGILKVRSKDGVVAAPILILVHDGKLTMRWSMKLSTDPASTARGA